MWSVCARACSLHVCMCVFARVLHASMYVYVRACMNYGRWALIPGVLCKKPMVSKRGAGFSALVLTQRDGSPQPFAARPLLAEVTCNCCTRGQTTSLSGHRLSWVNCSPPVPRFRTHRHPWWQTGHVVVVFAGSHYKTREKICSWHGV